MDLKKTQKILDETLKQYTRLHKDSIENAKKSISELPEHQQKIFNNSLQEIKDAMKIKDTKQLMIILKNLRNKI